MKSHLIRRSCLWELDVLQDSPASCMLIRHRFALGCYCCYPRGRKSLPPSVGLFLALLVPDLELEKYWLMWPEPPFDDSFLKGGLAHLN
jgi:hypothetical protein